MMGIARFGSKAVHVDHPSLPPAAYSSLGTIHPMPILETTSEAQLHRSHSLFRAVRVFRRLSHLRIRYLASVASHTASYLHIRPRTFFLCHSCGSYILTMLPALCWQILRRQSVPPPKCWYISKMSPSIT
jgi:hypothetical protein